MTKSNPASQVYEQFVLMVEDEPSVKRIVGMLLLACGYRLITANDGVEALAMFNEHRRTLTMVITDLQIPGSSGVELVRAIRKLDRDIPVVIASANLDAALAAGFDGLAVTAFLQKPFTAAQLLKIITDSSGTRRVPVQPQGTSVLAKPGRMIDRPRSSAKSR